MHMAHDTTSSTFASKTCWSPGSTLWGGGGSIWTRSLHFNFPFDFHTQSFSIFHQTIAIFICQTTGADMSSPANVDWEVWTESAEPEVQVTGLHLRVWLRHLDEMSQLTPPQTEGTSQLKSVISPLSLKRWKAVLGTPALCLLHCYRRSQTQLRQMCLNIVMRHFIYFFLKHI